MCGFELSNRYFDILAELFHLNEKLQLMALLRKQVRKFRCFLITQEKLGRHRVEAATAWEEALFDRLETAALVEN